MSIVCMLSQTWVFISLQHLPAPSACSAQAGNRWRLFGRAAGRLASHMRRTLKKSLATRRTAAAILARCPEYTCRMRLPDL